MPQIIPPWIESARRYVGLKEYDGPDNNPKIMAWAKIIGGEVRKEYTADSIPWCGLFVDAMMAENGIDGPATPLWALSWADWGIKLKTPAFGCVLSFKRDGGGHVAFYLGEDDDYYFCLGGNQSDSVNVTKVAKNRLKGITWPLGAENYLVPGRVITTFDEADVSVNEA